MHRITDWDAARSGTGITVSMTDAGGARRKQLVKKIEARDGTVTAIGGDGTRFPLIAGRETSAEVASIAGQLVNLTADELDDVAWHDRSSRDQLLTKIHTVAASALGQRS